MTKLQGWILLAAIIMAIAMMGVHIASDIPGDYTVTGKKLGLGSVGRNPLALSEGTKLDTSRVAIIFDDGKDIWDTVERYVDLGMVFSFAVPYDVVRMADVDSMTPAECQEAFSRGCEIINHGYTGSANYGSELNSAGMEKVLVRTARYFKDTLRVGCPNTTPLEIGYSIAGSDWREWMRFELAKEHIYSGGPLAAPIGQEGSDGVNVNNCFVRWNGHYLGGYVDTIMISAFHGGGSGTANRTLRVQQLTFPSAQIGPYFVAGGVSHGPSPNAGAGRIQQFSEAKAFVRFARRSKAAVMFYFHHWDSVYAGGDPADIWIDDFCHWLMAQEDSGRVKIVTRWDIIRDYVIRPPASNWNWFPDPRCTTFSWNHNVKAPDGWWRGRMYDYMPNPWHIERGESAGFAGDAVCASYKSAASHRLAFGRVVPPNCWVTCSMLINASECDAADSIEYRLTLDLRQPNTVIVRDDGEDVGGQNQTRTDEKFRENALYMVKAHDLEAAAGQNRGVGVGGVAHGCLLYADEAKMCCRFLKTYGTWKPTEWKELYLRQYVGETAVAVMNLFQSAAGGYALGDGLRIAYVSFSIQRRPGSFPVSY